MLGNIFVILESHQEQAPVSGMTLDTRPNKFRMTYKPGMTGDDHSKEAQHDVVCGKHPIQNYILIHSSGYITMGYLIT